MRKKGGSLIAETTVSAFYCVDCFHMACFERIRQGRRGMGLQKADRWSVEVGEAAAAEHSLVACIGSRERVGLGWCRME